MDFEIWKQRHAEMLREAEQDRLAKELRAARRRRASASRLSALSWKLKRYAGRLRKLLRTAKKGGQRTKE
jgi:hypothetical protein